jgi:hypothetical protein
LAARRGVSTNAATGGSSGIRRIAKVFLRPSGADLQFAVRSRLECPGRCTCRGGCGCRIRICRFDGRLCVRTIPPQHLCVGTSTADADGDLAALDGVDGLSLRPFDPGEEDRCLIDVGRRRDPGVDPDIGQLFAGMAEEGIGRSAGIAGVGIAESDKQQQSEGDAHAPGIALRQARARDAGLESADLACHAAPMLFPESAGKSIVRLDLVVLGGNGLIGDAVLGLQPGVDLRAAGRAEAQQRPQ